MSENIKLILQNVVSNHRLIGWQTVTLLKLKKEPAGPSKILVHSNLSAYF